MSAPALRVGARILLLDDDGRILLIHERTDTAGGTHWLTPGGGVEEGEVLADAATRELWEETGLALPVDPVTQVDFTQRRHWSYAGLDFDQTDHFFLLRVPNGTVIAPAAKTPMEQETVLGERWWTVAELAATTETIEPPDLAGLLESLL